MTPPEPPDDKPWRGPGPLFWLAMAFALVCLIAAAVVAVRFGVFTHRAGGAHRPGLAEAVESSMDRQDLPGQSRLV